MKCTMVESPDSFSELTNPPYLQLSWSKRPSQRNCPFSSQILLTSSSHVFHESWIYELFSRNFMLNFLEGSQYPFFGIFVQNCNLWLFHYFIFFLVFSKSLYHELSGYVAHCFKMAHFALFLENSDFYYWSKLENRSKMSLGDLWGSKFNYFCIR